MRPIAHRAFSILFAVLLVGSIVAPLAATQPVAAQDSSDSLSNCNVTQRLAFPTACALSAYTDPGLDTTQSADSLEVDIHTGAQGVYEGEKQRDSIYSNYLQDTKTLASLEARDAIATAYENNMTVTEAQTAGQQAINDYYATHQKQILAGMSADTQEIQYYHNITLNNPDISDDFISHWIADWDASYTNQYQDIEGVDTVSTNLANGTSYNYTTIALNFSTDSDTWIHPMTVEKYNATSEQFEFEEYSGSGNQIRWDGGLNIMNAPAASLESQTVYDYRMMMNLYYDLEQQAQTVQSNYPSSVAEDLYAAMDAGDLSPSEVRGAEGMVRYMSGNQTSGEAFELALRHSLDLEQPDRLNSTMKVHFDGLTDRVRVAGPDGNVSYNYTALNTTLEGVLFASGVPNGTIETGTTYNVSSFDGQPAMLVNGSSGIEEKVFWDGQFTVEAIYDDSGNAVDSVTYSGPEYQTYNATDYIQALEKASAERAEITAAADDGGSGGGVTIGDLFGGGNPTVGVVIVGAVVVLFIVGKVSN